MTRESGGVAAVVTHHEVVAGGYVGGRKWLGRLTLGQPRFGQRMTVDVHLTVLAGNRLARQADDPLDEVLDSRRGVVGRLVEDHDVPAVHGVEVVAELVDQHPVSDVQGGLHGPGGDEERLDDEAANEDGRHHRDDQNGAPLDSETQRLALPPRRRRCRFGGPVGRGRLGRDRQGHNARPYRTGR